MSFPRYEKYKHSGVEWLGVVPDGWEVRRLKQLVECLDGKRVPLNSEQRAEKQGSVPYWGANSIVDYVDEALFDEDLILLGEDGAPFFDKARPVAFYSQGPVWPNNHVHVLKTLKNISSQFITHALNITDYANFIDGSTRDKLTQGQMSCIPVPIPPLPDQQTIAAFLDRETGKIDALVAEQGRLIELLKEKRQAVISHAVTKGLNPDAPMKDSGIEWLGEVPEGWEVCALKRSIVFQRGHDLPADKRIEGDIPVVTSGGYNGTHNMAQAVAPGIVTGRYGTIGEFILVEEDYWPLNTTLYSIEMHGNVPGFLWYMLHNIKDLFVMNSVKSAVPGVDRNDLHSVQICLPPVSMQSAIVAFLDTETTKIDTLVTEAQQAIGLLKERRSALISAAVTGKIDVRSIANVH